MEEKVRERMETEKKFNWSDRWRRENTTMLEDTRNEYFSELITMPTRD